MVELAVLGAEGVEDCTGCRDDRGVGVGMALVTMVTTAHNDGPTPLTGLTSRTAETTAQDAMQALRYMYMYMYICDAGIEVHVHVYICMLRGPTSVWSREGEVGVRDHRCVRSKGDGAMFPCQVSCGTGEGAGGRAAASRAAACGGGQWQGMGLGEAPNLSLPDYSSLHQPPCSPANNLQLTAVGGH